MRNLLLFASLIGASGFVPKTNPCLTGRIQVRPTIGVQGTFPDFMPEAILDIQEDVAIEMAKAYQESPVTVETSLCATPIATKFVRTAPDVKVAEGPILLLHGFDSSAMEWRRLMPMLGAMGAEVYAMDVLGWGFTQLEGVTSFGPDAKRLHLKGFWDQVVGGRPMTLVGASLGGAIALDFAHTFPLAVEKLVLIDAQGFIDGSGPGASLPAPLARIGINILRSKPLRSLANQMSYRNQKLASDDAVRVGRLHVMRDGWVDASLNFMSSGGFSVSAKVPEVNIETLILWGRQDNILDPKLYAQRFEDEMPNARLVWVDECGHVPHLEQPEETARAIFNFVKNGNDDVTCAVCQGTKLQPCYNCDGQGSYETYGRVVSCKCCGSSGNIICRSCFKGDPWDVEEARARARARRSELIPDWSVINGGEGLRPKKGGEKE